MNLRNIFLNTPVSLGTGTQNQGLCNDEGHMLTANSGGNVITVTPVCDTSAYTAGDVLFDTTAISGATRIQGGRVKLTSVVLLDEDDQTAAAITLYFLNSNVSLGTANAAPSITDANARSITGVVPIASGDFTDVGGAKVACVKNIGLIMEAASSSTTLYVAATCAGTPTQTASGIKVMLGFESV